MESHGGPGGSSESPLGVDQRLQLRPDILMTALDGDTVGLLESCNQYFSTGSTGSDVLRLVASARSVRELSQELRLRYDVPQDVCERDVLAFCEALLRHGVIARV